MRPDLTVLDHTDSWPAGRLEGTLGSASDRDLDAHLLRCDLCLAHLVAEVLALLVPEGAAVPA